MIYFDNASTTKINAQVLRTYKKVLETYFANPSGTHTLARDVARLQDKARNEILDTLKYTDGKVVFTSGATEANNLAIIGLYQAYANRGNEIIISNFEHPSVREACDYLAKVHGVVINKVPVDANGVIDLKTLKKFLSDKTVLVSIMAVNNEIGAITNLSAIRKVLNGYPKVIFHSDVTQALGKILVNLDVVDAFSFSAHKIHGLKGSGALVLRRKLNPKPLVYGGSQEDGLRPGTHNAPANIVLAQTVRLAVMSQQENIELVGKLAQKLHTLLASRSDLFIINSTLDNPYIVNFSLKTVSAAIVLNALENKEIYLGTTSSCSAKLHIPSHTILAISGDEKRANNALRVSFSAENTVDEVITFFKALMQIIEGANYG